MHLANSKKWCAFLVCTLFYFTSWAQSQVRGKVVDDENGEELMGATISIVGTSSGTITDFEGNFVLKVEGFPVQLKFTYTGYTEEILTIATASDRVLLRMKTNNAVLEEAVIVADRVSNEEKKSPLSTAKLDALAIRETPAVSVYDGIADLPAIDAVKASMGFTVINMRGFNSTSPVRSLQIIDGVDNQAPGLNFSLGNFLGASDLDIANVDVIIGASSSFYGPNAFNGVVSMQTKDPFFNKGLSASLKVGERDLLEGALRYADVVKNKAGNDFMAFKFNFFGLKAYDWVADNYEPVSGSEGNQVFSASENPGGRNAVNIYGDEFFVLNGALSDINSGLNSYHRTGYQEVDLVDYDTKNAKLGLSLHFRTNPSKTFESPELIIASNYGTGTTVYQGDNRFSLRGIQFLQNRIEYRKRDKFFLRLYSTNEDAGRSYDPYFTAQKMLEAAKPTDEWFEDYRRWWVRNDLGNVFNTMKSDGYFANGIIPAELVAWQQENATQLQDWHKQAAEYANTFQNADMTTFSYFQPGTARFDSVFNDITSRKNNSRENGTRFYDKSALYHVHGEHKFYPSFLKHLVVGANARLYRPYSDGTIFSDSISRIQNSEWGVYGGAERELGKFTLSATLRLDKNQNFNLLPTPAASIVWNPAPKDFIRFSFSSAIRNPTLTDQYLFLRIGPASLLGNLDGFNDLITLESFNDYRNNSTSPLVYNDIAPIQPEKVKTFEIGYRTARFKDLYLDAGYYYNIYDDFIGFNIGVVLPFDSIFLPFVPDPILVPRYADLQVYRVSANASQRVTSQGASLSATYNLTEHFALRGSYSWNKLITKEDDPIVPAFNTPEHKFNVGFVGRDLKVGSSRNTWGFNVAYKWIEGFTFEGSPQFTGGIPTYDLLDAQVSLKVPRTNTTFKVGASNILNNLQFQTYGGPRIGRMAYASVVYDFVKK